MSESTMRTRRWIGSLFCSKGLVDHAWYHSMMKSIDSPGDLVRLPCLASTPGAGKVQDCLDKLVAFFFFN